MEGSTAVAVRESELLAREMVAKAEALSIVGPDDYSVSGELLKAATRRHDQIEEKRKETKAPILEAGRRIDAVFQPAINALAAAIATIKKKRVAWQAEAERLRKEAEEKARVAALKEQERLQQKADKKAGKLLEAGHAEEAERILDSVPEVPMPVIPQTEAPKTKGVSSREYWYHRVVNPKLVPDDWKCIDEKKLAAFARATKGTIPVPGVEFYAEATEAVRAEQ